MSTWTAVVGTVGLALVALVWFGYLFRIGTRALGGDDAHTDAVSATRRPSGHVATNTRGDHDGALLALQQSQRRAEFRRRCEAAASTRGPARINGRDVQASVPVEPKGAA